MRNETSLFKRSLAAVLCLVMVLGLIPVLGGGKIALEAEAAPVDTTGSPVDDYITLPITIRDFAADGMLFEWNEENKKGTATAGGSAMVGYTITENPTAWDLGTGDHTGFRLYDPDNLTFDTSLGYTGYSWHCVIVDTSTGNVVKVLAKEEVKTDTYDTYMQDGYISIWVWEYDTANYEVLSKITEANKNLYRIDFVNADMYIGYAFTKNTWGDYTGIRYFDASGDPFANNYNAQTTHCLICDGNGNIVKVIGTGEEKAETYSSLMQDGYFALFAWTDGSNAAARDTLSAITDENKSEYKVSFLTDTWYETELLYLAAADESPKTYNMADTQGFTFLQTDDNDYNNILSSAADAANPIAGTERTQLGSWNSEPSTETLSMTLNSGAKQTLIGGWIRTNLVAAELDDDNKPVYTAATVEYLAGYMADVMGVEWQNADGSYNTYHVEGVKLFDETWNYVPEGDPTPKVYDLADFIRYKIANNGLDDDMGSYTASHDKFTGKIYGKTLDTANDIETWCDAAYYLLHYYWRDSQYESKGSAGSDGYGMKMPQYSSLHLVKKEVDGQTVYVFNSGYDETRYDTVAGEIYNTQTDTMTTSDNPQYVYGNPLTTNRFDPLGLSGGGADLGYGMSGDTYGNMTPGATVEEYYSNTNYNLSLEGHAEFVYHYASDLYFTFTGDDDVYLYINGIRVLDVGAAHSIAKVKISLNDIATTCGLKEGEPARFDFFYLERHGSAANFGIETNIQLAESGMITTKNGYQNGTTTGYDGPVNPDNPVAYSFTLKNSDAATLENLTFKDDNLGVFLSSYQIDWGTKIEGVDTDGKPVDGGPIKNMYLYVRDENDNIVRFYSAATSPALTEDLLKEQLATGLTKGQSMTIYNLRYKISEEDWAKGGDTFTNVVNTTAEAAGKLVTGTADWKVHKQELNAEPIHIYNWVNKNLVDTDWQSREEKLTKAELVQPVVDAGKTVTNNADIVLCNSAGLESENAALWSEDYTNVINNVTLADDDSITYTSKAPGMVTIYYKIKGIGYNDHVFHFDVITYGVADNVYVLDYGLNVELNKEYGFRENDHLSVPQNINEKNLIWTMNVHQDEHKWGEFVANGTGLKLTDSVEYRPKDIIDGCDSITVTIQLRESGADTTRPLKFYGVDMDQNVSTAPANVVYYEENHPGITYVNTDENNWIHYETVDSNNNSTAGEYQSPDQDSNYGSDPNYEQDKEGTWSGDEAINTTTLTLGGTKSAQQKAQEDFINYLNNYMGLEGQASNGTINVLEIKEKSDLMYFDFAGTGFEIISRTTAQKYAVITVLVERMDVKKDAEGKEIKDEDGNLQYNYTKVKQKPVICESEGGDLYQVPIISITGLPHAKYRVTVKGTAVAGVENRILYIDGVRIYGPLEDGEALEYYNPEEYEAEFYEVKDMIGAPIDASKPEEEWTFRAIYADVGLKDDDTLTFVSGTTFIEYTGEDDFLVREGTVDEYLDFGPNNELYFEGYSATSVLMFYAKPKEGWLDSARTIEIGAHRKVDAGHDATGYATLIYGSTPDAIWNGTKFNEETGEDEDLDNSYDVATGTEQYYTIDVNLLEMYPNGAYLVAIGTNGNENEGEILALTTLKIAGYDLLPVERYEEPESDDDTAEEDPDVEEEPATYGLMKRVFQLWQEEVANEVKLPVNENLFVNSASLKASNVARGKNATLSVKASAEAERIEIIAPDGSVLEVAKTTRKVSGDVATFQVNWKVMESRGSVLKYTIRAYDAENNVSANTYTVTLTVK